LSANRKTFINGYLILLKTTDI